MVTTSGAGRLHGIFEGGTTAGLGPAELLRRFAATRDEAAFAALVDFHGPMVLATCRRVLPNGADADDAFQATFLIFARQARAIQDAERLAPWLHSVARRVACRAKSASSRRRAVEAEGRGDRAVPGPADGEAELRAVLDEELSRLPEKYRAPLVLCYLEGLTHDEAAGRLHWPVGTVRSRLAGGRDRLRGRLARRGFAPGALAVLSPATLPQAAVSRALQAATIRLVFGGVGSGAATSVALGLAQGVLTTMFLAKVQTAGLVAVALAATLTAGTTGVVLARQGAAPAAGTPASAPAPRPTQDAAGVQAPVPQPSDNSATLTEMTDAQLTLLLKTLLAGDGLSNEERTVLIAKLEAGRPKDAVGQVIRGRQAELDHIEKVSQTSELDAAKARIKTLETELAAFKQPNVPPATAGGLTSASTPTRRRGTNLRTPVPPTPPAVAAMGPAATPEAPEPPQPPAPATPAPAASPEGPTPPTPPMAPTPPTPTGLVADGPATAAPRPATAITSTATYTRNAEAPATPPRTPAPPATPTLTEAQKAAYAGPWTLPLVGGKVLYSPAERDRATIIDSGSQKTYTFKDPGNVAKVVPVSSGNMVGLQLEGPRLTEVVAFNGHINAWVRQPLREPLTPGAISPVVSISKVHYIVGKTLYILGVKSSRWGVLDLKEPPASDHILPPRTVVTDETVTVPEGEILHILNLGSGEWTHVNVKDDK